MAAKLGARSIARLETCDPDLVRVIRRAEQISPIDFTILAGLRSDEEQRFLYAQGRTLPGKIVTHVDGVNKRSKHQANPQGLSDAIDVAPWPIDWDDEKRFILLAGVILAAAKLEGVEVRWGGDWDRDGDMNDHRFVDLPHFELVR